MDTTKDMFGRIKSSYMGYCKRMAMAVVMLAPLVSMFIATADDAPNGPSNAEPNADSANREAPSVDGGEGGIFKVSLSAYDVHMIEAARFRLGANDLPDFDTLTQTAFDIGLVSRHKPPVFPLRLVDAGGPATRTVNLRFTERQKAAIELLRHDLTNDPTAIGSTHDAIVAALRAGLRCISGDMIADGIAHIPGGMPLPYGA